MSVVSHKTSKSSPSSILKKQKNIKKRLNEIYQTPVKVRFVLPHTKKVRSILEEYLESKISKQYENILCLIRDGELMDDDLSSLLKEATECISILNQELRLFVEAILWVNWTNKSASVVSEYQSFIVNLLSAHNYHAKLVIEKLVKLFLANPDDPEWPEGGPTDEEYTKCHNVHTLLNLLFAVVPMCKELLMASVVNQFPYYNKPPHVHEYYIHNILWILDYQPNFRPDILQLIFAKLVVLDVNAPKEEIEKFQDNEEMFLLEEDTKSIVTTTTAFTRVNRSSVAHTLDICLDKMFNYFILESHNGDELDWDKAKKLYQDMLPVFDKVILPTYNTHHVQYIMFLMCCFKTSITEAFLSYLWKKVCNPNIAPILRQTAVNYLASLCARANFIHFNLLKSTMQQLSEWIHSYISNQDGLECVNSDIRVHLVFYSVCQALFYIVSFRHQSFVGSKKKINFLESLNMAKMVTSRLNPLRVCQPAVTQNFAAVTRKYQLAYCYTIMEHNARYTMPTIYQSEKGSVLMSNNILDACYPFDPYMLERSGKKIETFYRSFREFLDDEMQVETEKRENSEVDDFLCTEFSSTPTNSKMQRFSYGSSPGFKFKA